MVTGGAGFIGCAVSGDLVRQFERVVVVDNLHPQVHKLRQRPAALAEDAELILGDVAETSTWNEVLARHKPTTILHLAAETGTGQSLREATRHARVNVVGTAVMLDALVERDCLPNHIVLVSSRAVYGEGPWYNRKTGEVLYPGQRTLEQLAKSLWDFENLDPRPAEAGNTQPMPVSVYGATKLAQENMLTSWANALGVSALVLRLQNVYGPGQSLNNPYTGIVSLFCQLARRKEPIPLYEDGRMLRDFVLIDDVVSAILVALATPGDHRRPYDIGTGVATTIGDLAALIAQNYAAPAPEVCGKYRFGDVRHALCDIARTKDALKWAPQHSVRFGLSKLQAWIETQSIS